MRIIVQWAMAAVMVCLGVQSAEVSTVVVSELPTPEVRYGVERTASGLTVVVEADRLGVEPKEMVLRVGVAARKVVRLSTADLEMSQAGKMVCWEGAIDAERLVTEEGDWAQLRMGFVVTWANGPDGQVKYSERFLHVDGRARHVGLALDPGVWQPVDLVALAAAAREHRLAVTVGLEQPVDGKVSLVIEDEDGNRIRNLVSGRSVAAGPLALGWDGLDDTGRLVAPGNYRWRSAHHPGIVPHFQGQFANGGVKELFGFGSNHSLFTAAAANDKLAFLAAPFTEGGHAMIAVNEQHAWVQGYVQPHGTGYQGVGIAATDRVLYTVHDGRNDKGRINKAKGPWATSNHVTLTRFDIDAGRVEPYGRQAFLQLEEYEYGPAAESVQTRERISLTGVAMIGERLYVGSASQQAILVVVPETGEVERSLPMENPGPLATDGKRLLVGRGGGLVWLDPATGAETGLATPELATNGLAVGADGTIAVSDGLSHQVVLLDGKGRELRRLGVPGGAYEGEYVAERLVNPAGLVFFDGQLWVTEDRRNPKRATCWDVATGKVVHTKYGNPPYGSPGACPDPADATRWVGLRGTWQVDLKAGTAAYKSIFSKQQGHLKGRIPFANNYHMIHRDGRTFLLAASKANIVSELMADGSLKDLALVSSAHQLLYAWGWQRVEAFSAAFEAEFPKANFANKYSDPKWRFAGVLWVDLNGDGDIQQDELEIGPGDVRLGGSGWGHWFESLTWTLPMTRGDGSTHLVTMQPDGYHASGAPKYPTLSEAVGGAVLLRGTYLERLGTDRVNQESLTLDRGVTVLNSDPFMMAFDSTGTLLWQYPNRWSNVHGSHKAPLPTVGELQGCLYFLGAGRLDAETDLFMLNGNHGPHYLFTSDGIFLDQMFRDVRMGGANDAMLVGGEPFGGYFGRTDDGTWYLQTGSSGYRVYTLSGLDRVTRQTGMIAVSGEQIAAAESRLVQRIADDQSTKRAMIQRMGKAPTIDGKDNDWPETVTASWSRDGRFPVEAKLGVDAENLYLCYKVADPSPWRNNGKDWTLLFKTGDSIDLQLGTNPGASATRRDPVIGDWRLMIAPCDGKPTAILYEHKLVKQGEAAVTFSSPWRSATVDSVRKLAGARIAVTTEGRSYRVEAAIPLAELGLKGQGGEPLSGDLGVLFGDDDGQMTMLRSYWSNTATSLVNDVPGEIMLTPSLWGTLAWPAKETDNAE